MRTTIQQLIHSFEIDRMQSTFTREQIIELLNYKLEQEKQQIIEAHGNKFIKQISSDSVYWRTGEEYYNEKFK